MNLRSIDCIFPILNGHSYDSETRHLRLVTMAFTTHKHVICKSWMPQRDCLKGINDSPYRIVSMCGHALRRLVNVNAFQAN